WLLYLRLAKKVRAAVEPAVLVGYRQSAAAMSRDIACMRRSFALLLAEAQNAQPQPDPMLLRWSSAGFDFYTAHLALQTSWRASAYWMMRALLRDPYWLARLTNRRFFLDWLGSPVRRCLGLTSFPDRSAKFGIPVGVHFDDFPTSSPKVIVEPALHKNK